MTKTGKILLVGIGPGAHEHMTFRARQAIAEADVVIGYSTYIKLMRDLLDGKEVIKKGMTEELDRSIEAFQYAKQGRTVALISSGDIGIYGMAGPTYELLLESGWTPDDPIQVEVIPGCTALSSCAALVGAPLTHDFCSISLSDLLTPWPVIATRLECAAQSDFVVALYNPKSGRRTQHIVEAQNILLRHRSPDTPVAIIKSAFRPLQNIQMVKLSEMADCDIGMLTTVLVGNSSTFMRSGMMVTPRGYANKYQAGQTRQGEQAGRSLSMGLEGWKAGVRAYLRSAENATLTETADYFHQPVAEILDAVTQATPDDQAGCFHASLAQNSSELINSLASIIGDLGQLRAVIDSHNSQIELFLESSQLQFNATNISLANEHFHLHVDTKTAQKLWFVSHNNADYGLVITDINGNRLLTLWLVTDNGQINEVSLGNYHKQRSKLTHGQC